MSQTIATDNPLDADQTATLRLIVGAMIPASDEFAVPGADDPVIFDDILSIVKTNIDLVGTGLDAVDAIAQSRFGTRLIDLDEVDRETVFMEFSQSPATPMRYLVTITAQCYYRDDRVMASLGMEARPPFPDGFEIPQGDLSLLDPVKERGPIWRAPGTPRD